MVTPIMAKIASGFGSGLNAHDVFCSNSSAGNLFTCQLLLLLPMYFYVFYVLFSCWSSHSTKETIIADILFRMSNDKRISSRNSACVVCLLPKAIIHHVAITPGILFG